MRKLTKTGEAVTSDIQAVDQIDDINLAAQGTTWLLNVNAYLSDQETLEQHSNIGVYLPSDTAISVLPELCKKVGVIGIAFPAFADGRGFSLARSLREHLGFQGELIALGNYMQDQLHFLKRCGFDSFELNEHSDPESMKVSLNDFTESYQAACDQNAPLFSRQG